MVTRRNICLLGGAFVVGLGTANAQAQSVPAPMGKVILTISGQVAAVGQGAITFDRDGLEALGMTSFETMTPWYATKVKFEGVSMAMALSGIPDILPTGKNVA